MVSQITTKVSLTLHGPTMQCDVMQKCGSLVANVQPDSCNMTRMFGLKFLIYLYLFEQECKQI